MYDASVGFSYGKSVYPSEEGLTRQITTGGNLACSLLSFNGGQWLGARVGSRGSLAITSVTSSAGKARERIMSIDAARIIFERLFGLKLDRLAVPSLGVGTSRTDSLFRDSYGETVVRGDWTPTWSAGISVPVQIGGLLGIGLDFDYRGYFRDSERQGWSLSTGVSVVLLKRKKS